MEIVSPDTLESLWNNSRMPTKRTQGILLAAIVYQSPAGDPRYIGGISRIVKLVTARGQHIGTLHEVVMPDGSVPHSHPKDYTQRDCSRVRLAAEPASR